MLRARAPKPAYLGGKAYPTSSYLHDPGKVLNFYEPLLLHQ